MADEDGGTVHLVRIARFQMALLPLGAACWAFRSWRAALVFAVAGSFSILLWTLHKWIVTGLLTPSLRRRWLFGFLVLGKLALIVLLLRGMMVCFPLEVLPLVTGVLLFSVSILLEAFWLTLRPD